MTKASTRGGASRLMAKNLSAVSVGKVLRSLLTLVYLPTLTRGLGPRDFGLFVFVQSLASQFFVAGDFGINTYTVRTVAAGVEGKVLVREMAFVRVVMFLMAFTGFVAVLWLIGYRNREMYVAATVGFASLSIVLSGFPRAVFRGNNWMGLNVTVELGEYLLVVIGTLIIFKMGRDLPVIGIWMAFCGLLTSSAAFAYLRVRGYHLWPPYGIRRAGRVLLLAAPLAGSLLLENLYYKADVILLERIVDLVSAGLYGSAKRVIGIFVNFPRLLTMASLPIFSMLYTTDKGATNDIFKRMLRWNLILSVAATGGLVVFADVLIPLYLGDEYADTAYNVRVQALAMPFTFAYFAVGTVIIASGRLRFWLYGWIVATVTNLGLNLLLIPSYADHGASWARLVSEIVAFSVWYALLRKSGMSGLIGSYISRLLLVVIVSAGAGFLLLRFGVPWLIAAAMYSGIFLALLLVFKIARVHELNILWRSLKPEGERQPPPLD